MVDVVIRLAIFLSAGLIVWLVFATWMTLRWLTRPPRRTVAWAVSRQRPCSPAELNPPRSFQDFSVESHGITLQCWLITGDKPSAPTLVLTHGWGDSRVTMLERIGYLASSFSAILVWDLPGHGFSSGACTLGTSEHIHIPQIVAALPPDQSRSLVLYGYSLGAGVSLNAAISWDKALPKLTALILEAPYRFPFTPAANVMDAIGAPWRMNLRCALACLGIDLGYGPGLASSTRFDRAELARKLLIPTLVLHGTDDTICPPSDGQAIASATPAATLTLISGAGHTDIWSRLESARHALSSIHTLVQ